MSNLERAIEIAVDAHRGQKRRNGELYILHPIRVMLNLNFNTEEEKITAILHDVVEDNPSWTLERLEKEGFSKNIVDAIDSVSRRYGESYKDFVERAVRNSIGCRIKLADLQDNYEPNLTSEKDQKRNLKYEKAIKRLTNVRNDFILDMKIVNMLQKG